MPLSKAEVMINLGVPTQQATELQKMIEQSPTSTIRGGVLQQAAFPDIGAAPTQANFNALLASLRAAGVIAP